MYTSPFSIRLFFLILLNLFDTVRGQWGLLPWAQPPQNSFGGGGCGVSSCDASNYGVPSCGGATSCGGSCGNVCPGQPPPPAKFPPSEKNMCTSVRTCKCYMNSDNFLCCNRELESHLRCLTSNCSNQQRWRGSNLQRMATDVQRLLQEQYGKSFEVISGSQEFCGKHSFKGDMMCKIKTPDCKVLMVYATPQQYHTDPCSPNTPLSQGECASKAAAWGEEGFQNTDI